MLNNPVMCSAIPILQIKKLRIIKEMQEIREIVLIDNFIILRLLHLEKKEEKLATYKSRENYLSHQIRKTSINLGFLIPIGLFCINTVN